MGNYNYNQRQGKRRTSGEYQRDERERRFGPDNPKPRGRIKQQCPPGKIMDHKGVCVNSIQPSRHAQSKGIKKYAYGGSVYSESTNTGGCGQGMHMMPDGTCMQGEFHGSSYRNGGLIPNNKLNIRRTIQNKWGIKYTGSSNEITHALKHYNQYKLRLNKRKNRIIHIWSNSHSAKHASQRFESLMMDEMGGDHHLNSWWEFLIILLFCMNGFGII